MQSFLKNISEYLAMDIPPLTARITIRVACRIVASALCLPGHAGIGRNTG
jgi:hypothetical protein